MIRIESEHFYVQWFIWLVTFQLVENPLPSLFQLIFRLFEGLRNHFFPAIIQLVVALLDYPLSDIIVRSILKPIIYEKFTSKNIEVAMLVIDASLQSLSGDSTSELVDVRLIE